MYTCIDCNFCMELTKYTRGGRQRPEKGVLLKCELSMGAQAGNNQAQNPEVAVSAWAWMLPAGAHMLYCPRREPYFSPSFSHISPPNDLICVIFIWIVYISIKIFLQQKWGKTEQHLARHPILAYFPTISLREISKRGAKKVEILLSPNVFFWTQDDLVS